MWKTISAECFDSLIPVDLLVIQVFCFQKIKSKTTYIEILLTDTIYLRLSHSYFVKLA